MIVAWIHMDCQCPSFYSNRWYQNMIMILLWWKGWMKTGGTILCWLENHFFFNYFLSQNAHFMTLGNGSENAVLFLAATKQLYDWFSPSVCLSVRPSHLFHHVPIIVSSWNFQELLPMTKVTSMQKFKVRGQRSRSQRSTPNLTVSGL